MECSRGSRFPGYPATTEAWEWRPREPLPKVAAATEVKSAQLATTPASTQAQQQHQHTERRSRKATE